MLNFKTITLLFITLGYTTYSQGQSNQSAAAFTEKLNNAGILFLENKGQLRGSAGEARPDILFSAKNQGCKVFVTANGLSYQFEKIVYPEGYSPTDRRSKNRAQQGKGKLEKQIQRSSHRVDMRLLGANPSPVVHREQAGIYHENYYNIPEAPDGILGVHSYEKLRFEQVYPGIDWLLYSNGQGLKYDFVVQPGADPALIRMDYSWADGLKLNADGSLSIYTTLGVLTEAAPVCFQGAKEVQGHFVLNRNTVSIAVDNYDRQQPLVIDPCVVWATYYGGMYEDYGSALATDNAGHVYLVGETGSMDNIASGGHQDTLGSMYDIDAFLVKFNAAGNRLWATYYGGMYQDYGTAVATDNSGHVYLAGTTESMDSIESGGHQDTLGGYIDAFLVQFDASSGARQWGTYYGGMPVTYGHAVATDNSGHVYLAGSTMSTDNIAFGGHQDTFGGDEDAFLVKFDAAGVRQWATYYGGLYDDNAYAVATDNAGNVYLAGETGSMDSIAFGGHQDTFGGDEDVFLVKFDAAGVRQWGTYYGGTEEDWGSSIATDNAGHIYLAGDTESIDGIASGGHQDTLNGDQDVFLVQFDAAGVRQWGTYYGGNTYDWGGEVATDAFGYVYLTGVTESNNGIASGGHQNTYGGSEDAFLVQFDASGVRQWGTYYGGMDGDAGNAVATDLSGHVYLAGVTGSMDNIVIGGHQDTYGGDGDAFLVKFYPRVLNLTETIVPITCRWETDGSILAEVADGLPGVIYNYNWSTGATTPMISSLAEGNYTVTVTLGAACSATESYAVPGPAQGISIGAGYDDACYNKPIGKIFVNPRNGWGGFTYLWSNGDTDSVTTNLAAGTYTVTITDQGGCTRVWDHTVETEGGEPVTFATEKLRLNSGEAIEITMDAGMFWVPNFIWSVSKQVYAKAEQPLNGVWDISDGPYTNILESDNLRYPGEVEFLVAPQYFPGCNGDTVKFLYEVIPSADGVFVPEIYTPNGDGQTDTWNIELPPDFQNTTVTVYNRAGAKVYEGSTTMPWDGRDTPDGTYFYVIQYTFKGQQHALKGAVTILRSN